MSRTIETEDCRMMVLHRDLGSVVPTREQDRDSAERIRLSIRQMVGMPMPLLSYGGISAVLLLAGLSVAMVVLLGVELSTSCCAGSG